MTPDEVALVDLPFAQRACVMLGRQLRYVGVDPEAVAERAAVTMSPQGLALDGQLIRNYGHWVLRVAAAIDRRTEQPVEMT